MSSSDFDLPAERGRFVHCSTSPSLREVLWYITYGVLVAGTKVLSLAKTGKMLKCVPEREG